MPGTTTKVPFADASPEELRAAILPDDHQEFDRQYQRALQIAAGTLRLDDLDAFLAHWRRMAWTYTAHGHDEWRALMADADQRLSTGQRAPDSRPWEEVEADLGL